ncbi:DNA-binding transcriptional ArsR family regulator [Streptomyces sp. PvR006]|uniref:ArsR/SmtB family transcription factor n=1 Tax=Streptomyces sp. PvR006 TaxID=2817860 RepID=UPI001AE44D16|nr:winged helix-turn-helix domain-containing protein [Streptomyces sp. PvR006]MBP2583599.1 DNA-binding transcriptional ArsR family regulator [Streptomyces sp. PvR006]
MELEERVAALERRLAVLESTAGDAVRAAENPVRENPVPERPVPEVTDSPLWALESLKAQLAADPGDRGEDGAVVFTGTVRLPTDERYEWQLGAFTGQLFEEDWADAAESFAALGHPVRLRLLREILGGRRTAAELAELDEIGTTGQIYHHLRQLTGAGWLRTVGRGRHEVPGARVVPLLVVLTAARP